MQRKIKLFLVAVLFSGTVFAGERVSLFDGKTLAGWTLLSCEGEVKDGNIFIKSGNGLIQSEKKYSDFVLELEWKKLGDDRWDSGIYFRYAAPPEREPPWPARYQINLRKGQEGNVGSLKEARTKGLIKPDEWNKFKLTVKGTTAELEINGAQAWKADGLAGSGKGFISLQAEVPQGGQHLFRNIYVTELK